jgi:hypothetical protein
VADSQPAASLMQRHPRSGSSPEVHPRRRPAAIILRDLDKLDRRKQARSAKQTRSAETSSIGRKGPINKEAQAANAGG